MKAHTTLLIAMQSLIVYCPKVVGEIVCTLQASAVMATGCN
jgi:hypothetical protein